MSSTNLPVAVNLVFLIFVDTFNPLSAPSSILCELGMRTFTGSRDMPKDVEKAVGLFMIAE